MKESQYDQLSDAVAELDEPKVHQIIDKILAKSPSSADLDGALQAIQEGMDEVGRRYQSGEYFLAEMIFAAQVVKEVMPQLTSALDVEERESLGQVVIGTVKGDIHDIGKNLVVVILTAAGFDVVDLGADVPPQRFVQAIEEHKPAIVGLSGLLTLAVDPMKQTVDAIREAGLRDHVKVIIGGNPVTEHIHNVVGSDAWTNNAAEGLEICRKWVEV